MVYGLVYGFENCDQTALTLSVMDQLLNLSKLDQIWFLLSLQIGQAHLCWYAFTLVGKPDRGRTANGKRYQGHDTLGCEPASGSIASD
ncbi:MULTISPECIES: hypothetical protein [Moorena]|uniref:hypothetical protein n=1 Tax=Moorena TaxID=1155738 RepID=UPI001054FA7B|nr:MULTISPECIES: hypothetical protein [Moorena]NEQ15839.1 hypothetical protein [Moorena sp. SIO3E2]NEP31328.1 hypothetical protein [Moorena sp. SIO3B2]NEQ05272.1 hypothetical protein [Moorena sp. SIO4E2]NER87408.1 hypothetical protein [Moorena sp. SIO3A2]NES43351.1 hypothetical protein [Moorena sp. SIO2C4]